MGGRGRDFVARVLAAVLPRRIMLDKRYYPLWEERGYHVTPVHFYEPLPDSRDVSPEQLERRSPMVGIDLCVERQLALLHGLARAHAAEYAALLREPESWRPAERRALDFPDSLDGFVLYAMVRHLRPRRVTEIGAGMSSLLVLRALAKNAAESGEPRGELESVDPFPPAFLDGRDDLTLHRRPVQDVPLERFTSLGRDDILFIDSSHVLKIGSDVQREYLEIVPSLAPGVMVHAHDIHLPYEYPEAWIRQEFRYWNEQYLLQAFLSHNAAFEVVLANQLLHREHAPLLSELLSFYLGADDGPGSFWFRRRSE